MKCRNCKIEINSPGSNCPLCGSHLDEGEIALGLAYPDVDNRKGSLTVRILLFVTIVLSIASFIVNMLTPHKNMWSIIVIYGMWLIWLVAGLPIINRKVTLPVILMDYVSVCAFLYMLDRTFSNRGWALSYVIPFVLCGSALVMTIIILSARISWRHFFLFQGSVVIICWVPLLLGLFMDFELWPSIICAAYGLTTLLGMIILGNRRLKNETKKRFHF